MTATPTSSDFSHSLESETLAAIRDALLPKLLSGEIRIEKREEGRVKGSDGQESL